MSRVRNRIVFAPVDVGLHDPDRVIDPRYIHPLYGPEGPLVGFTEQIKKRLSIPIIAIAGVRKGNIRRCAVAGKGGGEANVAEAEENSIDWDAIFENAGWFHISGITPAISMSASRRATKAVQAARDKGVSVSCDLNFRKKLWNYGKKPHECRDRIELEGR